MQLDNEMHKNITEILKEPIVVLVNELSVSIHNKNKTKDPCLQIMENLSHGYSSLNILLKA